MTNNNSIKFLSQKSFDNIKEKVLNSDEIFNKEQEKKFIKDEIIAKDKLYNFDSIYLYYNIKYLAKEYTELNYREQKRRNIFGVIYPNKFIIFNRGGYNASIRQFINNIFYKEKKYKNLFF